MLNQAGREETFNFKVQYILKNVFHWLRNNWYFFFFKSIPTFHSLNIPLWVGMEWTNIVQEKEIILIKSLINKYLHTDFNILSALHFLAFLLSETSTATWTIQMQHRLQCAVLTKSGEDLCRQCRPLITICGRWQFTDDHSCSSHMLKNNCSCHKAFSAFYSC